MESDIRRALDRVESSSGAIKVRVDTNGVRRQGDEAGREFASRFTSRFTSASQREGANAGREFARRFESAADAHPASSAGVSFGGSFGKIAGGAAVAGFVASLAIGLGKGVVAVASDAADEFRHVFETGLDFSKTLNNFQGVTRATTDQMAQMQKTARALGSDTTLAGASSSDAALAMTELAKAGFTVDQSMTAARGTLELATAGQIDAAKAAEIQSNAMNAFGIDATQAAHVADLFANAAVASSADIPDLGIALQQVGGIAHGFGENLDDTIAALGIFANAGVKGSDAGTLLKTTMQSITDQSNPAQGAIQELGLSLYKLNEQTGDKQFVGFRELFRQLDEARHRAGMTSEKFQALTNVLFGSDAMRSAMLGNADAFDKMLNDIEHVGGASELAASQMQGLPGAVESFNNTVEGIRLDIFDKFGPALAEPLNDFITYLSQHKDEVVDFFVTIGGAALTMAKVVVSSIRDSAGILGDLASAVGLDDFAKSLHFVEEASGKAVDSLGRAENGLEEYGRRAAEAKKVTDTLGDSAKALTVVGAGVLIDVKDNTPATEAKLNALGIHLHALANDPTRLELVADTEEGKRALDAFRAQQAGEPLKVGVYADLGQANADMQKFFGTWRSAVLPINPGTLPPPASTSPLPGVPFAFPPKPRATGGLFSAMPSNAMIQPATEGLIQWAEPTTGGEAFIPLAGGQRSVDIWAQTGHLLGMFDQGGFRGLPGGPGDFVVTPDNVMTAVQFAESVSGNAGYGPSAGPTLFDCSGFMSAIYGILTGKSMPTGQRYFTTEADFTKLGFVAGYDPSSPFNIGVHHGGPGGGHMAGNLMGYNVESGGGHGGPLLGPGAAGPTDSQFEEQYHLPGSMAGAYAQTYGSVDPKQLREAQERVADADARLAIQQKQLDELKADASESQRMQQKADVDKAKREAADARADLAEVQRGKPQKDGSSKGGSSGPGGEDLGSAIFSGFLQSMGFDGSVFSNPFEWPNVKSGIAAVNFGGSLLKAYLGQGQDDGSSASGGGGFSLPGLPGLSNLIPSSPQALTPADSAHAGSGALPGPAGPAVVVNGDVGMDPRAFTQRVDAAQNQALRRSGLDAVRPG
jgi:TP901 family phage tail tape measure protein